MRILTHTAVGEEVGEESTAVPALKELPAQLGLGLWGEVEDTLTRRGKYSDWGDHRHVGEPRGSL